MNDFASHFSLKNIPFGVASRSAGTDPVCVTRVANDVVFLAVLAKAGFFAGAGADLELVFSMVRWAGISDENRIADSP